MEEYYIHQHALSQVSRTRILDKSGQPVFLLVGRRGTLGDELCLYDLTGAILAKIKQVSVFFGSRFELIVEGEKIATMTKLFSIPKNYYYVKSLQWTVRGDIVHHQYTIVAKDFRTTILQMSHASTSQGMMYCLQISDEKNVRACLLIASVLDYWNYASKMKKEASFVSIVESCS